MAEILITREYDGRVVEVSPGDQIIVRLPGSPTTGYQWTVSSVDETILSPGRSDFERPVGSPVGGSGEQVLRFSPADPGTTNLVLEYRRMWETDSSPGDRFEIAFSVQP